VKGVEAKQGIEWLKPGLIARVRYLKGEEKLRHDPNFKRDVAKKYTMVVFPETIGAFEVDLKGTFRAMAAGRKCLKH